MKEPVTITAAEINDIVMEMESLMILGKKQIRDGNAAATIATLKRIEQLALRLPRKRDA